MISGSRSLCSSTNPACPAAARSAAGSARLRTFAATFTSTVANCSSSDDINPVVEYGPCLQEHGGLGDQATSPGGACPVPALSVVVPFRNAERHIGALLESIARQTFTDLEVVMVDDGPADGTPVIAKSYATRDRRFHLVQQHDQGSGPGPARNTGVAHATGTYLAFADSDGLVTPRAYELLTRSLAETGSDMACGGVARIGPDGISAPGAHEELFRKTTPRTHVSQRPALLQDQTCWNKVYRRSFWDSRGLEFPGPVDAVAPVMIRAHVLASSVDVLRNLVYYWRDPGGPSAAPDPPTTPRPWRSSAPWSTPGGTPATPPPRSPPTRCRTSSSGWPPWPAWIPSSRPARPRRSRPTTGP